MTYIPGNTQFLSTNNSTNETLSASSTYVGTFEKTDGLPTAQIWVMATGAATLFIEFSPDNGATIDQFPFGGITLTPGIPYYDHVEVGEQSFRIRVQDTSAASNDIITLVSYGFYQRPASIVSTGIDSRSGSINTKAVIFGENQETPGSYIPVKVSGDGGFATSPSNTLINFIHDAYTIVNVDATTDRYDYYTGGLAGTKVAEIEIIYTTSSKSEVLSAERTLI